MRYRAVLCLMWAVVALVGCDRSAVQGSTTTPKGTAHVAVSNSYLEAAFLDVMGATEPVLRLADPGMCPGHFDLRPSQVNGLRSCRILLRFEFQNSLDAKLGSVIEGGLRIGEIRIAGGLCEPSSYIATCRQVADALVLGQVTDRASADGRLVEIEKRLNAKTDWCRRQVDQAGWGGRAVICSGHQEAFCTWLGLKVVATFSGADTASIEQIEEAIRAGDSRAVGAVIANLPEGRRLADALGQRLKAPVVVFGNFPAMQGSEPSFDALLTTNVTALLGAKLD